jgi:hypothetical protein
LLYNTIISDFENKITDSISEIITLVYTFWNQREHEEGEDLKSDG